MSKALNPKKANDGWVRLDEEKIKLRI